MPIQLSYQWITEAPWKCAKTGVSLHSHTSISKESIGILFEHGARNPIVNFMLRREKERYFERQGKELDFNRVYWTSPVTPQEALQLEARQIEHRLQMRPMVSITDHDEIEANKLLQLIEGGGDIPLSTEWTVPFENTFFHFGIHNLPKPKVNALHIRMQNFRKNPMQQELVDILAELASNPEVLIVLNHPAWDEAGIGKEDHDAALERLLELTRGYVHALELNGLRTWRENLQVVSIGESTDLPLISGGDRHGHEPNAILNVSNASDFSEFVAEVRDGNSHVVVMPQYRENRKLRCFQTAWDMIREHPEHPFKKTTYLDRTYFIKDDGKHVSLSEIFTNGAPPVLEKVLWAVRLLESPQLRPALRVALSDGEGLRS